MFFLLWLLFFLSFLSVAVESTSRRRQKGVVVGGGERKRNYKIRFVPILQTYIHINTHYIADSYTHSLLKYLQYIYLFYLFVRKMCVVVLLSLPFLTICLPAAERKEVNLCEEFCFCVLLIL